MINTVLLTILWLAAQPTYAESGPWKSEVLFECADGMGGVAIGDLDPDTPGNEVAVVNAGGEVWLVRRVGAVWRRERIYSGDGELIMCAIGDADPRYAGNELVGVGMMSGDESTSSRGHAVIVHRDAGGWVAESVFTDDQMLHGVAIGDVSSRHKGNEIVTCGFNHRVTLLHSEQRSWVSETIYVGNDRLKITLAADLLPERTGFEAMVCGSDGNIVLLWEGTLGWNHKVIFSDPVGQSRIAATDLGVLIGGDKGKVTLAKRQGSRWLSEFVFRDGGKIRGVAIADVDPSHPGPELYTAGYSTNVIQLVRDENGFWKSTVIFTAARPLHHLLAGEFDLRHPGPELVTCGHGGKLIALYPGGR